MDPWTHLPALLRIEAGRLEDQADCATFCLLQAPMMQVIVTTSDLLLRSHGDMLRSAPTLCQRHSAAATGSLPSNGISSIERHIHISGTALASVLCTKPPSDRIASSRVAASRCWYLGLSSVTGTPLRCRCAVASASNLSPPPPPFLDAASHDAPSATERQ